MQNYEIVLNEELKRKDEYETQLTDCHLFFDVFNHLIFEQRLKSPTYVISEDVGGYWATYEIDEERNIFEIECLNIFPSKSLFLNVFAHELIHHYQGMNGYEIKHGKHFWKWKSKFSDLGLKLQRVYG